MRIGQAIDNIFQDKKREYKAICEDGYIYTIYYDLDSDVIKVAGPFRVNAHKLDWKLVQEPVTFMDAVESGKPFRVEHNLISPDYMSGHYGIKVFLNRLTNGFSGDKVIQILTDGKFYIEEDN